MEDKPDLVTINLDEEFKTGLNTLRPFILRLSSVEDAKLTRLWLEKLRDSLDERKLRNVFLRELTEQVQAGKLRFPFNKPPPVAPLYVCQDGGGEEFSSTDSYSGSSKYFHPRGDTLAAMAEKPPSGWKADGPGAFPNGLDELIRRRRTVGKSCGRLTRPNVSKRRFRVRGTSSSKSRESRDDVSGLLSTISSLQTRNEALAQEVKLYQETATKTQKNLESVQQEVIILKNKLDEMRAINTCIEESNTNVVNDYRKALTESVKRLSERLDTVSKRNVNLEEKVEKLKQEKKSPQSPKNLADNSEMKEMVKKLKRDLDIERRKRAAETHALKNLLAQKENQLAQVDSHVQHQCDKMQKEVTFMKHEIDRTDQLSPSPKFKEKISGLRKHVYHVERTNKKILGVFERKLNQYKEECDRKINFLHKEVEAKDRLANGLQTALKKAETQYRKHIMELQESCKAQRTFDHQRIAALEERLRNRLFD